MTEPLRNQRSLKDFRAAHKKPLPIDMLTGKILMPDDGKNTTDRPQPARCGHDVAPGKRSKRGLCPACRQAGEQQKKIDQEQPSPQTPRKPKQPDGWWVPTRDRLPNGATISMTYIAQTVQWVGQLQIPVDKTKATFSATASSVRLLHRALDDQYRAWLKEQNT